MTEDSRKNPETSYTHNKPIFRQTDHSKEWWLNGYLHREDGPAYEHISGYNSWIIKGKRHRIDGPAIDSLVYKEWWINGKNYTQEDFNNHPEVIAYKVNTIIKQLLKI